MGDLTGPVDIGAEVADTPALEGTGALWIVGEIDMSNAESVAAVLTAMARGLPREGYGFRVGPLDQAPDEGASAAG
jgi:hypothetical protein